MFSYHQFKYVCRSLIRQKSYSFINIFGLSVAMASIVIISLWISNELSYDKSYPNADRIYRLTEERNTPDGNQSHFARISWNIPIEDHFPEIEAKVRLAPFQNPVISIDQKKFNSDRVFFSDPSVFHVFGLKLRVGDTASALSHPNSVIISEKIAQSYFGKFDCVGSAIQILSSQEGSSMNYTVTGVFKDLPVNSHLHFELLISFEDPKEYKSWAYNYVLISNNAKIAELKNKLPDFVNEFYAEQFKAYFKLYLQSIKDIHLHSKKDREIEQKGNYQSVLILLATAIFIFIIALINSINLNVALVFKELKYLKSSKIFGAKNSDLLRLQLLKAATINALSIFIALLLIFGFKNIVKNVFWMNTVFLDNHMNETILILIMLAVLLIILGGLTIFLFINNRLNGSRLFFNSKSLVGLFNPNNKFVFRKLLLIIQFSVSFILIISSIVVNMQMSLISSNQMGKKDIKTIVIQKFPKPVREDYDYFKQQLSKSPFVKEVTASMETPPSQIMDGANFEIIGQKEDDNNTSIYKKSIYINSVDDTYFDFYDLKILFGEDFPNYTKDQDFDSYIINETAMKYLGYENPEDIVGISFKLRHGFIDFKDGKIIGVVNDFYYSSLHHQIEPMVYFQRPEFYYSFFINIDSTKVQESVKQIEQIWDEVYPSYPFAYSFSDQIYNQAYINEYTQTKLSAGFSIIAIIISFTGLIGLTTIMTNRRKKEIGIRKVLGSSMTNIVRNLSMEFFQMIFIASVIAFFISFYIMNNWLQNFVYRISLTENLGVLLIIFIGLATSVMSIVALMAYYSARKNPINCLRDE